MDNKKYSNIDYNGVYFVCGTLIFFSFKILWIVIISSKLAFNQMIKNNIHSGCLYYKRHYHRKIMDTVIVYELNKNNRIYEDDYDLFIYYPKLPVHDKYYKKKENHILDLLQKNKCYPVKYVYVVDLPFWQSIRLYDIEF